MGRYILRRAISLLPVFFLMTIIVFAIIRMVPGDPIDVMYGTEGMDEIQREALRQEMGLDQPLIVQYGGWLWRAMQGDMGRSYRYHIPVMELVLQRLPATLLLSITALALSVIIAIPLGLIAATRRNSWGDFSAMVFAILGISLPSFWSGIMLTLIFAVMLKWLPSINYISPLDNPIEALRHLVLPAVTLGWSLAGTTTRLTRSSVLEELSKDYVRTARSKGLSEPVVVIKHALRNAMIPTLTMIGLQLGFLFSGAVVVEVVFAWQGIGQLLVESILSRDYPVVQGVILIVAAMVVLVNLMVDFMYTALDPRIRLT